jgi:poly(A) polymerase
MSATTNDSGELRRFAENVVRKLRDAGHEALFAGGCVRDLLLGLSPKDYDVATSARPEVVQSLFRRTIAVGKSFGVIQVRGGRDLGVEVATFRADGDYVDGRHPATVRFTDAREDALRRDFTINGMFLDPIDGKVLDFVGGQEDLDRRVIRAIGDPERRFQEDKLRLLRTVRFAAKLGFSIDDATFEAVRRSASELSVVSGERILAELRLLMDGPWRAAGVELLFASNLANVVFSDPSDSIESAERPRSCIERIRELPDEVPFAVSIAVIFDALVDGNPEAAAESFFTRLKGSNEERDLCDWLLRHRGDFDDISAKPLSFRKRLYADPRWDWLCAFASARGSANEVDWCRRELASLKPEEINPPPLVTGDDLTGAGLTPGPQFKVWLERLRDRQLNGEIASKSAALELVRQWAELKP